MASDMYCSSWPWFFEVPVVGYELDEDLFKVSEMFMDKLVKQGYLNRDLVVLHNEDLRTVNLSKYDFIHYYSPQIKMLDKDVEQMIDESLGSNAVFLTSAEDMRLSSEKFNIRDIREYDFTFYTLATRHLGNQDRSSILSSPVDGKIWERTVRQIFFTPPKKYMMMGGRLDRFFHRRIPIIQIMSGCKSGCLICLFGNPQDRRTMPFVKIEEALDILYSVREEYIADLKEGTWDILTQQWLVELLLNSPEAKFEEMFSDFIPMAREYLGARSLADKTRLEQKHPVIRRTFLELMNGSRKEAFLDWLRGSLIRGVSICQDIEPMDYFDEESGKDISDVVDAIHARGFDVWLVTHGWKATNTRAQKAAERLNALPYNFQVHVSFHIWHQDVFKILYADKQQEKVSVSEEQLRRLAEKYYTYFVNIIQTFKEKDLVLRNVYDGMGQVTAVNDLQGRILKAVLNETGIAEEDVWPWAVEWTKGRADAIRQRFNIESLPMWDNYANIDRVFNNIYLNFSIKGESTFYVENMTMEDLSEQETLIGSMLDEGYLLERIDQGATPEMYVYRIKGPQNKASSSPHQEDQQMILKNAELYTKVLISEEDRVEFLRLIRAGKIAQAKDFFFTRPYYYKDFQLDVRSAIYPGGLDLRIFELFPNIEIVHFVNMHPFRVPFKVEDLTFSIGKKQKLEGQKALDQMKADYLRHAKRRYIPDPLQRRILYRSEYGKAAQDHIQIGLEPFIEMNLIAEGYRNIRIEQKASKLKDVVVYKISFFNWAGERQVIYYWQQDVYHFSAFEVAQLTAQPVDLIFEKAFTR